jgi:hypothetical protein
MTGFRTTGASVTITVVPGAISSATLCANSVLNRKRDASLSASTPRCLLTRSDILTERGKDIVETFEELKYEQDLGTLDVFERIDRRHQ